MLISPADYPAKAATANISAADQKKLLLKRITVKSTNPGTGATFLLKYMIWQSCLVTASEYFIKEYNIVQVTKNSPLKAPKRTSLL